MNSQILLCFELSGVQMTLSQCMPSYVLCIRSNKVAPEVALHEASACGGNFEAEDSWGWTSVAANKVCSWGSLRGTAGELLAMTPNLLTLYPRGTRSACCLARPRDSFS